MIPPPDDPRGKIVLETLSLFGLSVLPARSASYRGKGTITSGQDITPNMTTSPSKVHLAPSGTEALSVPCSRTTS